MPDIIQLLPDNIANQIAAGEVIQRPSSAVKELLENAVDAGATQIQLIVADAGKALIQVIDNGSGMSPTDARMAFERHATSKIKAIDDLFQIKTLGFRGEALASIAAVAQVEVKTRKATDELGTYLTIENSVVTKQESCACAVGTSIAMKNLFFNVPARRNFLKSNASELKHILEEFIRVAMAYPSIQFSLTSNGQQVYFLEKGGHKQRIIQIMGNSYNAKLSPVNEDTDYMKIFGFIGKPETAKKTRGDQYFFVNNRFIKSPYLNHAVSAAFEHVIAKDSFPSYVLYIEVNPAEVDINVHPTKQEIKFEDEKIMYAFVNAAVKHALAQGNIMPSLDFSLDPSIQQLEAIQQPQSQSFSQTQQSSIYQTFTQKNQSHAIAGSFKASQQAGLNHWKDFFEPSQTSKNNTPSQAEVQAEAPLFKANISAQVIEMPLVNQLLQVQQTYIVAGAETGLFLVHQQLAHERILYEKYSALASQQVATTQKILFPITLSLAAPDAALLHDLLPELVMMGYEIEPFGNNSFIIQGTPADVVSGNEKHTIELLLEQFKHFSSEVKLDKREKLIRCLSRQHAIKAGKLLTQAEMQQIVTDLWQCQTPQITPSGSPTFVHFSETYIDQLFEK